MPDAAICKNKKCASPLPEGAIYCPMCGRKQIREKRQRVRANGEGSVYFHEGTQKWRAVREFGSYIDEDGKKHRPTKTASFDKKLDANKQLSLMTNKKSKDVTLKGLYDLWKPTHTASPDTMGCYSAAMNHFKVLWYNQVNDIDIDDLQECIYDCTRGKRTRQNMRTTIGLIYKYGIPRGYIESKLNLSEYLKVSGDGGAHKEGFSDEQVELIKKGVGTVKYADYIYALIYLGFRPSEFLALSVKDYNNEERAFVGGAKTDAGIERTVTVSPKIQKIIDMLTSGKVSGSVFCLDDGSQIPLKTFREKFYGALDELGIENPVTDTPQGNIHKYTPHSCRHTFATLMKYVDAPDVDKLAIIGHTDAEMLRYYQDVKYGDLRNITDKL